jgi:hypothetical protein
VPRKGSRRRPGNGDIPTKFQSKEKNSTISIDLLRICRLENIKIAQAKGSVAVNALEGRAVRFVFERAVLERRKCEKV